MKEKKEIESRTYRFHKAEVEEEKSLSPNESSKDADINDLDTIISQWKFSKNLVQNWQEVGPEFNSLLKELKKIIQKLVKTRNNLFSILKKLHDFLDDGKVYQNLSHADVSEICKVSQKIQGSNLISAHNLWQLGTKYQKVIIFLR